MPKLPRAKRPSYLPPKRSTGNARSHGVHRTYRWERLSKKIRSVNPCEVCQYLGHIHPSQDVDHIIPLPEGAPFDPDNLMPMCKAMHGKKSQLDKEGFRVSSRQGVDGLCPVNRDDAIAAIASFEGRNREQQEEWL